MTALWNRLLDLFGPKDWAVTTKQDRFVMRRRRNGQWEYREPTAEESAEAEWMFAIK